MAVNKPGKKVEFNFSREEATIVKAVEFLINLKPLNINQALFEDFNSNYAWDCYWVLEEKIQAIKEQNYPLNLPIAKAFKPGGKLMLARLNLCQGITELIDMPYSDVWHFWIEVEANSKQKILEIANRLVKNTKHTKGKTNSSNRKFKHKLLNKENPYQEDKDIHLFRMLDASLQLVDYSSESFSKNFLIDYWNPFIQAWKTFLDAQEKGIVLDNGRDAETKTRRIDGEALVVITGGRKKVVVNQANPKNISGRGRKKSKNNPCSTSFSATLPAEEDNFEDLSQS